MEHKDFSPWRVKSKSEFKLHDIDTLPKAKDLPSSEEWQSTLKKLGDKLNTRVTVALGKSKGSITIDFASVAEAAGVGIETLKRRANELHEFNPMLGHRGCRLGVTYPEIYEMQARAIFEAACDVAGQGGEAPVPEIMIPLVATRRELEILKALVDGTAAEVFAEKGRAVAYHVGTMIELPRAALMAGQIAEVGEFFSFGTNDLTQTTLGVSRDDASRFLNPYVEKGFGLMALKWVLKG